MPPPYTCRAHACGCTVNRDGAFCDHCEEFTPICPQCGAVYGEHRLDCEVPDNWTDCLEGPWDKEEEAYHFAEAEVGVPWFVLQGASGRYFIMTKEPD